MTLKEINKDIDRIIVAKLLLNDVIYDPDIANALDPWLSDLQKLHEMQIGITEEHLVDGMNGNIDLDYIHYKL